MIVISFAYALDHQRTGRRFLYDRETVLGCPLLDPRERWLTVGGDLYVIAHLLLSQLIRATSKSAA